MAELRRDPVRGHWSIIAPGRTQRPDEYETVAPEPLLAEPCPFCPGNEGLTPPEIDSVRPVPSAANGPGWLVRVVPNQYPALAAVGEDPTPLPESELFRGAVATGAHEIVIATPDHGRRAAQLDVEQWDRVLAASQYRMQQLAADRRIKHVVLFQNHGAAAGASRTHTHLQILALPMASTAAARALLNARSYFNRKEHCLFCDLISHELDARVRLVHEDESFACFAPWAPRLPYELWVMPRAHRASFLEIAPTERRRLAAHMRVVLRRLEALFGSIAYNWVLHTVPVREANPRVFHWHIEILPRLIRLGGFELGTGAYINATAPETAAEDLRGVAGD